MKFRNFVYLCLPAVLGFSCKLLAAGPTPPEVRAAKMNPKKRPDRDYAVSWVRTYGKGRVFYTTLGHEAATYWNPVFPRHLLSGIQFAIGDLDGPTTPVDRKP